MCARGVYTWCVHVVCACGVCTWCVHAMCACGVCTRCVHAVCARGVCTWCVHVVCARGVCSWCVKLGIYLSFAFDSERAIRDFGGCHGNSEGALLPDSKAAKRAWPSNRGLPCLGLCGRGGAVSECLGAEDGWWVMEEREGEEEGRGEGGKGRGEGRLVV